MPRSRTSRRSLAFLLAAAGLLAALGLTVAGATALRSNGPQAVDQVTTYSAPPLKHPTPPASPVRLSLAVLGDSVPAASACDCAGFGDTYGREIAAMTHSTVQVNNLGTPRQTSEQLLTTLAVGQPAAKVVAGADIVTVTIGANDFDYGTYSRSTCADLSCYDPVLLRMRNAVDAVLTQIAVLRAGRSTAARVTGYWDIWKDGAVGRAEAEPYSAIGDALTRKVNAALSAVAAAHGVAYVDLITAFRGASGTDDDTNLLAADGDHPNNLGHNRIAGALLAAGLAPLGSLRPAG